MHAVATSSRGFLVWCVVLLLSAIPLPTNSQSPPTINLERISYPGHFNFTAPIGIAHAGDGSQRLFLIQQDGTILLIKGQTVLDQPFLNISARVSCCAERGLLGLAFPPDYARRQVFYVNYTDLSGNTMIARYRATSNPDVADPNSEQVVLTIPQPFDNHNGGQLLFGPDGCLYIGMGDGGGAGDPLNFSQNPGSLLGKLLRIQVSPRRLGYTIPATNPYVNTPGYRGEIWALGLRNPWRLAFDRYSGDLYIADVGQFNYEEVNVQPATSRGGENYGWRITEGAHCYNSPTCDQTGLTPPTVEYEHNDPDPTLKRNNCAVIGGIVYHGVKYPRLQGMYIYGDFCSGRIWGLKRNGASWQNTLLFGRPPLQNRLLIAAIGEDEQGELYAVDRFNAALFRVVEASPTASTDLMLTGNDFPDPVTPNTNLTYTFTVTNIGATTATGIQVNNLLPAGSTIVSASTSTGSCAPTNPVTCVLNPLASTSQAQVVVVAKSTKCGIINSTAHVVSDQTDPTSANNTVAIATTVAGGVCDLPPPPPCQGSTRRKCR
ncbi:MAG: DUF11 domain-containing protein [Deltaproteobacteria bacterium]|nr:DUF11 domain-containing protein [Deltaproteobacteria bacterium]